MLVLIIMMIITIPKQNHSVNLNMPVGNPPPPTKEPVVVTIDVDFDGTILWDNVADSGSRHPGSEAGRTWQPRPTSRKCTCVRTSWSSTRYVAGVMASAQRLGVTKIGMVGNEQFQ